MVDIYPYGGPAYVTWAQAYQWFINEGFSTNDAAVFAAIGSAESSLNYRVINDTPATRDYSVGIWQINYYGSLYASRAAAYGTPAQLVAGGLSRQAFAALGIYRGAGNRWTPWSTYNSGAYRAYMHGFNPPAAEGGAPLPAIDYLIPIPPVDSSDSHRILTEHTADQLSDMRASATNNTALLNSLRH